MTNGKENGETFCMETEEELIEVFGENKKLDVQIEKHKIRFNKTITNKKMKVVAMKTTQKSIYCPATFNIVSNEKCAKTEKIIFMDTPLSILSVERSSCPIGEICTNSMCDGYSRDRCSEIRINSWMEKNTIVSPELSQSYFFHRCVKGYTCNFYEIEAFIYRLGVLQIQIEGDIFGKCVAHITDRKCTSETGWSVILPSEVIEKTREIDLPCLKRGDREICWDFEENEDFELRSEVSTNGNIMYKVLSEVHLKNDGEPNFHSGVANLHDLEAVYNILQYENMQSIFNAIKLKKEVDKIKEIVSGIIMASYVNEFDPLFSIRGVKGRIKQWNGTHITLVACRKVGERFSGNIQDTFIKHSRSLFPQTELSMEEIKPREFRVQIYDEMTLKRLLEGEKRKEEEENFSGINLNPISGFFGSIGRWLNGVQNIVFWTTSILNLFVLKVILRRAIS
uniref:Hemagglutinin protein n=1 Tax=Cryptocercus meridianus orthomyxovirus 2 TaxID=3133493 RepID=A0AAT9JFZ0_9ORTO